MNIKYTIIDQEDDDKVILRSHDFEKIWDKLESLGDDRGHMSVGAEIDGESFGWLNGYEVHEYGDQAWD